MGFLRTIDFGRVSGLRSQTLWHAIAHGVSDGSPPTLSYMQPGEPYVSIGYHRSVQEINPGNNLPVFRRMVGGGPVYVDDGQHFFQVTVPVSGTPARRAEAVRMLLEPAVRAFNDVGIAATLDDANEVVVGESKICGHAAGQIEQAVVVVGNLIGAFDHDAAAAIVRAPSAVAREEFVTQMRRYVTPTPSDPSQFFAALSTRYGQALNLDPTPGELTGTELSRLDELDVRFVDPEWVDSLSRGTGPFWRVKVKSGVWVGSAALNGHRVTATFHGTDVQRVRLEGTDSEFEGLDELISEMAATPPV